jgi:hypothetical protein
VASVLLDLQHDPQRTDACMAQETERNLLTRDAYRSAVALALLIVVWFLVAKTLGPQTPPSLDIARQILAIYSLATLAYLVHTWRHPHLRLALVFSIIGVVGVVVLIPWIAWAAAQVGEQWRPIASAQLAVAGVPLFAPFPWMGYLLLGVFTLELLLVVLYQQQLGFVIPAAEPFASLCISAIALAVLLLRAQRNRIGLAYIRRTSEAEALSRLSPLLASICQEIERAVVALSMLSATSDPRGPAFARTIARLSVLREQLDALNTSPPNVTVEGERSLLAKDSYVGATIFALAGLAVAALAAWGTRMLPLGITPQLLLCVAIGYAAIPIWLWSAHEQPSLRRGVFASTLLLVSGAIIAVYVHLQWVRLPDFTFPTIAPKLLLMVPVLLRMPRLWIGILLLSVTAIPHIIIQVAVAPERPALEPWHMLVFALIGLGYLIMGEQRRIASIALLRAEVYAASLFRQANLSLAICDQLNTPLQTLVGLVATVPPSASTAEVSVHLARLRDLSKELTRLVGEFPPELHRSSLDAARELVPPHLCVQGR